MNWVPYIGIPYEEKNCWQLIELIYKEVLGIELGSETYNVATLDTNWTRIELGYEQRWDVIMFDSAAKHVGMIIGDGQFIHNEHSGINSCIESYRSLRWKERLKRIYRHRLLMYSVA